MNVCVLVDRPDHPVVREAVDRLESAYRAQVALVDVRTAAEPAPVQVCLLKSRTRRALALAGRLADGGARIVNTVSATRACLDRVRMDQILRAAGVLTPRLAFLGSLRDLAAAAGRPDLEWPLVVKSRRSRRGDLVRAVPSRADLHALAATWPDEEVIAQRRLANDGWDYKLWSIGGTLHAALRPSSLERELAGLGWPVALGHLPSGLAGLASVTGAAFGLELYGVDVLITPSGPVVIDVNAFPGFRTVPGAAHELAAFVATLVSDRAVST